MLVPISWSPKVTAAYSSQASGACVGGGGIWLGIEVGEVKQEIQLVSFCVFGGPEAWYENVQHYI